MTFTLHHHDSTLGRWVQAACRPKHLTGLVDSLWYFEGRITHSRERIFPDGRVELNVQLGAPYGQINGGRREPFPTACLSGVLLGTATVDAPPERTAVLGIRFLPAGAATLLGHPLRELADVTIDLHDLIADAAADLIERCTAAAGAEARLCAAVRWLFERADRAASRTPRGIDSAVTWAAGEIERRCGALSISELHDRTGWSKSRFTTAFHEQFGVSPKHLARIVRFRSGLELLNRGRLSLAEVALSAGYYDQPHFNGEFREFAGFSPGEYLAARRYPESANLVEAYRSDTHP